MFDFEKEYDLVKTTIEEIRSARRRIQAAADEQRKVEEKAILDRARANVGKDLIYILILDPDDEALCRCISTVYENILRHLIDVEIYHYVESDYKIVATEKVNKLTRQMPTMDQSIVVDLSETKYGLCSYKIACITVDDFIDHILGALKYEKRYFAPLLRLGCAWDD